MKSVARTAARSVPPVLTGVLLLMWLLLNDSLLPPPCVRCVRTSAVCMPYPGWIAKARCTRRDPSGNKKTSVPAWRISPVASGALSAARRNAIYSARSSRLPVPMFDTLFNAPASSEAQSGVAPVQARLQAVADEVARRRAVREAAAKSLPAK